MAVKLNQLSLFLISLWIGFNFRYDGYTVWPFFGWSFLHLLLIGWPKAQAPTRREPRHRDGNGPERFLSECRMGYYGRSRQEERKVLQVNTGKTFGNFSQLVLAWGLGLTVVAKSPIRTSHSTSLWGGRPCSIRSIWLFRASPSLFCRFWSFTCRQTAVKR